MPAIRVTRIQLVDKAIRDGVTIKAHLDFEVEGLFSLSRCALVHYDDRRRSVIWPPLFAKAEGETMPTMKISEPILLEMRRQAGEAYDALVAGNRDCPSAEDLGLPPSLLRPAA